VLLADGSAFRGAITTIPPEAADDEQALAYGETAPETIAPDAPGDAAFRRASDSPHRRVIVVDDGGNLLGLLCLDPSRTRFCQTPGSSD
jgi:CBS domain-containing protein